MPANPQYIEKWVRYLNDTDREMSCIAAEKLASTKDISVVPHLVKALKNRPDDVRIAVLRSLGSLRATASVKSILPLLRDHNPMVATTAANALGEIGDAAAVSALSEVVRSYKEEFTSYARLHTGNRALYLAALSALDRIGTPQARTVVKQFNR